jgi:hypothetical protein
MGASIRRQRAAHVHFLREVAFVVASDIPLVACMWLDKFSLRRHDGRSWSLVALTSARVTRAPLGRQDGGSTLAGCVTVNEDTESTQTGKRTGWISFLDGVPSLRKQVFNGRQQ